MKLIFKDSNIFISGLNCVLGGVHRNLDDLASAKLLSNQVEELAKNGYQSNYGAAPEETLVKLATGPLSYAVKICPNPGAFVFHHSYGENALEPRSHETSDLMSRARYFPVVMMRQLEVDHVPYFGSFATGCSGFISLLLTASGLLGSSGNSVVCFTGDVTPPGASYDALHERILTSDCCSSFLVGRQPAGYQLMAVGWYSSPRAYIQLVEIVKRTVGIVRDLVAELKIDLPSSDVLIHYPNNFSVAWNMVSQYLRISKHQHVQDEMRERAHCLSSDSIITLAKLHSGRKDRWHIVVSFGSGIHLGICVLREQANHVTTA